MSTAGTSRPLPRPLHLVLNSTGTSGLPTPLSASANAPLSAPLSLNMKEAKDMEGESKFHPRRQSSISYSTGSSKARSPTLGLGRSNSLGSKAVLSNERTRGAETGASKVSLLPRVRETEPVTLAEKHADLLHFIAQKESKCLELRTQLAQHEADLLLLKRKWERIVSKGLPSSARSDVPTNVGSEMLDGIRGGVQSGLGKVFAALEPSLAGPSSPSHPPLSTPQFKSGRHSQSVVKEAFTSPSRRASVGTVSSGSRDRSSHSGSRSSASSLFDDLPSLDRRSSTSSIDGVETARPSPEIEEASAAGWWSSQVVARRNTTSTVQSLTGKDTEASMPEVDPSSQELRSRPTSTNLSHSPSPLSVPVASESSTPLSRQMANWVPPGLNKKWEELKGSETLSKQSKRASILLNDVLAVLAPPIPLSPKATSSTISKKNGKQPQPPSHHNLDSSFFDPANSEASSVRVSSSPSPSLLDEEDECKLGEVLQPQVKVPGVPKELAQNENEEDKEEEDWNW